MLFLMASNKKRSMGDYISEGFEAVSEGVGKFARNKIDRIADNTEDRFMAFQDRMIKRLASILLFGIAIVFLSLGAFYLLKELFSLTDSISFFIIGILLVVIGILVKSLNQKN